MAGMPALVFAQIRRFWRWFLDRLYAFRPFHRTFETAEQFCINIPHSDYILRQFRRTSALRVSSNTTTSFPPQLLVGAAGADFFVPPVFPVGLFMTLSKLGGSLWVFIIHFLLNNGPLENHAEGFKHFFAHLGLLVHDVNFPLYFSYVVHDQI